MTNQQRSVPWLRLLAEGMAITISIVLALAAQAWWEGQQDRAREQLLLAGLLSDFQASRPLLIDRIDLVERLVQDGALFGDAVAASAGQPSLQVPGDWVSSAIGAPTFQPAINTLTAALSSGDIGLIRSDEIRAELSRWQTRMNYALATPQQVRQITDTQIVPLLGQDLALGAYFDGSGPPATIRPTLELSSVLALRHRHQLRINQGMRRLLETMDHLIELLEAELADRLVHESA